MSMFKLMHTSKRTDLSNVNQSSETAVQHVLLEYETDGKSAHLVAVFSCLIFNKGFTTNPKKVMLKYDNIIKIWD